MDVRELKSKYNDLAKKYKVPAFVQVNENFEIEKIDKDVECLLRLIRKVMMEKIVNSLSFLELIINPVNAPRIYLNYIRSIGPNDRKEVDNIYSILGALSIASLDLELDYSEKKEADMIKKIYDSWESIKPEFRKILKNMKNPIELFVKKEKSYFG